VAAAVGIAALALAGAGFVGIKGSDNGSNTNEIATPAAPAKIDPVKSAPDPETEAAPAISSTTTSTPDSEATTPELETTTTESTEQGAEATDASNTGADPTRRAIMSGGIVYLRGAVPSQEVADAIQAKAAAVLGADRVVVEYVIDPTVELSRSAPLVVEDVILFEYGSASINPEFFPLLDLGIALMYQNPSVVITVVGHTDSDGSFEFNQRLSEARAAAVTKYWVANGVSEHQFESRSLGETQPVADESSEAGAQSNRRVEFIISGLLD
jgi:outer membrane protein OmpA-like peptidoglycan-associated protein